MRQGQPQNRQRSRGRGNNNNNNNNRSHNNRNQMNRSMESNGPDVRIRGTAAHIAEKYVQLANDALTSGDTVAAQSYWQYAEHYNRLIATAQAAQQVVKEEQEAKRAARGEAEMEADENRSDNRGDNRNERRPRRNRTRDENADTEANAPDQGDAPQPEMDEVPAEVALAEKPAVEAANGEDAPVKPRRSRRPRKTETAAAADDDSAGLPSFVTGGE